MSLASMVVDFNSYFASVEQQARPELRGRPVAVVPMMADSTCAIAASYEAKAHGVKTGTLVRDARRMCPGIEFVEARHALYVRYHHELVKAVDSCMWVERVMSIDEMLVPLTGRWQRRDEAVALARRIKEAVARVGECLRCSIGIAPNPFLAKTASDMQKPDGLVVIEQGDLPHVLHRLALRDLCGIGAAMEARLRAAGIATVEQLCAAPRERLHAAWGSVEGSRLYELLRGNPVPRDETSRKSVGHSHVLPPEERNEQSARAVLQRLLQKAATRLRHEELLAGALAVKVKFTNRTRWKDETVFGETDDTLEFIHALEAMWGRRPKSRATPIAVAVTLHRIATRWQVTPSLFAASEKRAGLNQAIDELTARYGRKSAYFGGAHTALRSAPMRIAFTHVPDLETEDDDPEPQI